MNDLFFVFSIFELRFCANEKILKILKNQYITHDLETESHEIYGQKNESWFGYKFEIHHVQFTKWLMNLNRFIPYF